MSRYEDKTFTRNNIHQFAINNKINSFEEYEPEWHCMANVEAAVQPWFWPGMIPSSTLTLFAGVGGIGKSLLLLYIASRTSSGKPFMAGGISHQLPHGKVILLSAEDDCSYQIKPKLIAMEADTENIYFIKSKRGNLSGKRKFIELDKDISLLEQQIQALENVKLIIIDPITYFIGEVKDHVGPEVANFLNSLIDLSCKYDIAILLNKHLRKQAAGTKGISSATSEVGGSGAWTNTPRKCWLITNHHDDANIKVITQMKDNLSKNNTESLAFRVNPVTILDKEVSIQTTELVWLDQTVNMSADEAVDKQNYEKSKLQYAIDFILAYLKENGQAVVAHIQEKSVKKGVSNATFRRAMGEIEQGQKHLIRVSKGVRGAKIYQLIED